MKERGTSVEWSRDEINAKVELDVSEMMHQKKMIFFLVYFFKGFPMILWPMGRRKKKLILSKCNLQARWKTLIINPALLVNIFNLRSLNTNFSNVCTICHGFIHL